VEKLELSISKHFHPKTDRFLSPLLNRHSHISSKKDIRMAGLPTFFKSEVLIMLLDMLGYVDRETGR
jgi:hypothetical protein